MKKLIRSMQRFIVKHADIDSHQSICRDAYGNVREFCKLEKSE